jgi:dTDP-4-amino-4,6-dideoxygalactose transaminase
MQNRTISYALLERQYEHEKDEIFKVQKSLFETGQFILGSVVEELEIELAKFCGVKYCVTLNSGTDALILGMIAAGIGPGDEVITPPNSFVASTAAIIHVGAKPIFVDVRGDQNIDPGLIEKAITNKTKAIMPVHLTGRIAAMREIQSLAKKYGLLIVEDAAQCFGSQYHGSFSGSFGDIGCFSAHPLKAFNACGDAGFMTTNNEEIYARVKRVRAHGMIDRNTVQEWGWVSRLDTIQAAILRMRLTKIEKYIQDRRKNVELYRELLNPEFVFIPPCKDFEYNSFQTFVIQVDRRDELQKYLLDKGIQTSIHYPIPIHLQPVAKSLGYAEGTMPVTELQAKRILSLPVSQFLAEEEIVYISEKINEFYK